MFVRDEGKREGGGRQCKDNATIDLITHTVFPRPLPI